MELLHIPLAEPDLAVLFEAVWEEAHCLWVQGLFVNPKRLALHLSFGTERHLEMLQCAILLLGQAGFVSCDSIGYGLLSCIIRHLFLPLHGVALGNVLVTPHHQWPELWEAEESFHPSFP